MKALADDRAQSALVVSNALAAVSGRMQLLLHGWLIVAWGHSVLLLIAFAVARVLPKLIFTVPAGLLCDRLPRPQVLAAARWLSGLACVLPLAGLVLPLPLAWLILGIVLSGSTAAFDQPARKATLGDITARDQLASIVALNNGGAHVAALVGTMLAFALGPAGLVVAAILLAGGAVLARSIDTAPIEVEESHKQWQGVGGFLRFLWAAPIVGMLICLALAPLMVNKAVTLALPSFHESRALLTIALAAPEVGGIFAASALFLRPVHLPMRFLMLSLATYAAVLAALGQFHGSALLLAVLALGGVCQALFDTSSQVRIQQLVPSSLRGRVFAI